MRCMKNRCTGLLGFAVVVPCFSNDELPRLKRFDGFSVILFVRRWILWRIQTLFSAFRCSGLFSSNPRIARSPAFFAR